MYQRRRFCRGGENECKTTLFVTGTSFNLLTCINVVFLFYIYIVRGRVLENRGQTEKKVSLRWKTYGMYWLCKFLSKFFQE